MSMHLPRLDCAVMNISFRVILSAVVQTTFILVGVQAQIVDLLQKPFI